MPLYPSIAHQLSVARQHDAESAAARFRLVSVALQAHRPQPDHRHLASAHGHCADVATA